MSVSLITQKTERRPEPNLRCSRQPLPPTPRRPVPSGAPDPPTTPSRRCEDRPGPRPHAPRAAGTSGIVDPSWVSVSRPHGSRVQGDEVSQRPLQHPRPGCHHESTMPLLSQGLPHSMDPHGQEGWSSAQAESRMLGPGPGRLKGPGKANERVRAGRRAVDRHHQAALQGSDTGLE